MVVWALGARRRDSSVAVGYVEGRWRCWDRVCGGGITEWDSGAWKRDDGVAVQWAEWKMRGGDGRRGR